MGASRATPLAERVTPQQACSELSKFFVIADMAGEAPGMFSAFIDAVWHRLAATADYSDFCHTAVGHAVTHAPINGEGEVAWLDLYHERFGALPAPWFADKDGTVDAQAYGSYLDTHTVRASWNCQPTGGDDGGLKPPSAN